VTTPHPKPRIGVPHHPPDEGDDLLTGRLAPYVEWVPPPPTPDPTLDGLVRTPAPPDTHASIRNPRPTVVASDPPDAHAYARDPWLPVVADGPLDGAPQRERFVERVFAHARLRALFASPWRPRDLIAFHSRHKLQVLAHDPARYRESGRVVAACAGRPPAEVAADYTRVFTEALALHATPGRTTNALQHAFGLISARLTQARRTRTTEAIDAYRAGDVPLAVPVALLRHDAAALNADYLGDQTLLAPFPDALGPRRPA
jgi:uncharacterized protein YbgA (DUF1722 family)